MSENDIRSNLSAKEQERLAKIDKLDSNKKRKKIILGVVAAVLIGFFVFGTVFGGMYILSYEGTEALPEKEKVYSPLPETEEGIISSFASLTDEAQKYNSTKLDVSFDVNIPDESIVLTGDTAENSMPLLMHIKSSFVSLIDECYKNEESKGSYGTDFSSLVYKTDFTAEDAQAEYLINEENENDLKYIFTFDKAQFSESSIIAEIFSTDASASVTDEIRSRLSDMVNITELDIAYDSFNVTANIIRDKNMLDSVIYKRICNVTVGLEFIGEYSDFGNLTLTFTAELNKKYDFTTVEMYFTSDVFYVTKGASDEFKTKVISDESPADTVLTFTSSDDSVLSVDGRFYKANSVSKEPVTVTVEYTYMGVDYKDTCEFYVIVPVEGIKQNEKEISLKKGETKELSVTISPDDATLTDIYWFTTDANIVTVDENGVVEAIAQGTASVYCITRDGNYKSSCTVTITD